MKRTMLVLALGGLCVAASASPPPGAGTPPIGPIDVNVVNELLDVSSIPAVTPIADIYADPTTFGLLAGQSHVYEVEVEDFDRVAVGLIVEIDAGLANRVGRCSALINLRESADGPVTQIGASGVTGGFRESRYLPLPNVFMPVGSSMASSLNNTTDAKCEFNLSLVLVRAN